MAASTPRVLLFYFPLEVWYSHGLSLLKSILAQRGVESLVIPLHPSLDIAVALREFGADFAGFSFVTKYDYAASLPYIRAAKEAGVTTMGGGPYATMGGHVDSRYVDFVCRGDGEKLPDFIIDHDTAIFDGPQRCDDLDALPLPDYSGITGWEFTRGVPFLGGLRIFPYSSSRGCPYKCSFCASNLQANGKMIRFKKNIGAELAWLHDAYAPDLVYLLDELPPYYSEGWRESIKGNQVPFMCYIRADATIEQLEFLYNNGMRACAFGVESGDVEYRNSVLNKDLSNADLLRTVTWLRSSGVHYSAFYMSNPPYKTVAHEQLTRNLSRVVGGWPLFWDYEDLAAKVFDIPQEEISRYADKMKVSSCLINDEFNLPSVGVIRGEDYFYLYEIKDDSVCIREISGNAKDHSAWHMDDLGKKHGVARWVGVCHRPSTARLVQRYGFAPAGVVVKREA